MISQASILAVAAAAALTFAATSQAEAAAVPKAHAGAEVDASLLLRGLPFLAPASPSADALAVRGGGYEAVPAQRGRRAPRDWSRSRSVRDACQRVTQSRRGMDECLSATRGADFDPTPLIRQCNRATRGDRALASCVSRGAKARYGDPSGQLAACDRAMRGERDTMTCFDYALRARYDMRSSIAACDRALNSPGNKLQCVESASASRRDVSREIAHCGRTQRGERSTLACVDRESRSTPRRRR
jgi:hypothetical protein